jgi:hypothetical protein
MKLRTLAVAALLAFSAAASSQTTMRPVQPMRPMPAPTPTAQAAPIEAHTAELEASKKISALEHDVKRLETENADLKAKNTDLQGQVTGFSTLGGSLVHAYCPADNNVTSKNTAGAQADCGAAGYTCEPVSGLCRTSCQTSDMCAPRFTCDTGKQQCVRTG